MQCQSSVNYAQTWLYEEIEQGNSDLASISRTADYAALRLLSNAAGAR
jgi:hypothetical protein